MVCNGIEECKLALLKASRNLLPGNFIEGMACMHCVNHVQQALSAVPGVKEAKVDLESKSATVSVDGSVTDAALKAAVDEAGYQAVSIR